MLMRGCAEPEATVLYSLRGAPKTGTTWLEVIIVAMVRFSPVWQFVIRLEFPSDSHYTIRYIYLFSRQAFSILQAPCVPARRVCPN